MSALVLLLILLISPAPCQSSHADLLFNVVEEQGVGTYIGAITENQYLYRNLNSTHRKHLRYRLLDKNQYPTFLFRVDEFSGRIYVASRIDRESKECYQQPACILEFNVALSSSRISFSNIVTVLVKVTDRNDNPPFFPLQESGSVVLDILESKPIGTAFRLTGAADRDFDKDNTVQRYALTAYSNVFSVKSSTNLDGGSLLDLSLLQPLDREVISNYRFSILAFDGGSPPLSAALAVQIHVTDENDNSPVFLNDVYNVEIQDRVKLGQIILRVSASDSDSGEYGKVHYRFSSLQRQQLEQKFQMDEVTGEISVMSELSPGVHQFIVEAWDGGSPPVTTQTKVRVKVISSKNNPPFLQINTLSDSNNTLAQVPEDAEQGALVAFITAKDQDEGARGDITCYLNNDDLRLEALANTGYKLAVNTGLDRETRESYDITVKCSDKGHPPLTTSKSLLVVITDVNDNQPKFTWDTYSHIVPEGNYSNRHVIQVTATDPDMGKNAELIYSIDNSADLPFKMDSLSGIISATGQLDRETTPVYTFKVYVADRGQSPKTATANVIITLEDVNDQYPTFNKSIFEFHIAENAADRTLLGMLSAYDTDEGNNRLFEFSYVGSQEGSDPFVVTTDGKIWTSGELDREQRDSYSFTVMVQDKGLPPKITYASVVVIVLDVNDNAPRIQFPVSANHTVHVSAVPESGMILAKIIAYDPDAAENGRLHFEVLFGNEDGAFDINPIGGEVKVKDVSKLKNKKVYRLVVGVKDHGLPPRNSNTDIVVNVNFDNNDGILLKETEEEAKVDNYVIILVSVAGAIIVLSTIIIVAICFFFRQNRQHHDEHSTGNNQADTNDVGEIFSKFPIPHENLCDNEKLGPNMEETGYDKSSMHTTSFISSDDDDSSLKTKQLAAEAFRSSFRNSKRKKEVSFASTVSVAESTEAEFSMLHTYGNIDNVPAAGSEETAGILEHRYQLVPRQVDEVGSEASGAPGISNSQHDGSEGDVNIDHILHSDGKRQEDDHAVPPCQPPVENERYSRLPPPQIPKREPNKPFHVRFDTSPSPSRDFVQTNHSQRSRLATSSSESVSTNQKTSSFLPAVQSSAGTSKVTSMTTCAGSFPSSTYKDVSFTPLPQHSPQRTLSTFSSSTQPKTPFTTFQKGRNSSQ